jgi:hypothetical protein
MGQAQTALLIFLLNFTYNLFRTKNFLPLKNENKKR